MWPFLAAGGGILGLLSAFGKASQNGSNNRIETKKQEWADITGESGGPIEHTDFVGPVAQGAMGGAMFGQGLEATDSANGLRDSMKQYYNNGGAWGINNRKSVQAQHSTLMSNREKALAAMEQAQPGPLPYWATQRRDSGRQTPGAW